MKVGHWYKFFQFGETHVGQYMGNSQGFSCCVCDKGCKAHEFNIWHCVDGNEDYETWAFGKEHMPEIIEDLGEKNDVIWDWWTEEPSGNMPCDNSGICAGTSCSNYFKCH